MDIHCRHCGEPWDHDELHSGMDHERITDKLTYEQASKLFAKYGCGAFEAIHWGYDARMCDHAMVDAEKAARAELSQSIFEHAEEWK